MVTNSSGLRDIALIQAIRTELESQGCSPGLADVIANKASDSLQQQQKAEKAAQNTGLKDFFLSVAIATNPALASLAQSSAKIKEAAEKNKKEENKKEKAASDDKTKTADDPNDNRPRQSRSK